MAIVRAERRARLSSNKLKPVSQRRRGRRSTRRPLVANVASEPESASSATRINMPAAHEVIIGRLCFVVEITLAKN